MTAPIKTPFRAGYAPDKQAEAIARPSTAGPTVLLADVSEWEPDINDAAYLAWSKAVVIRAAYGASHQDRAWYGGDRRAQLHEGGARFLGIYQYLVAGQDGARQADVLCEIIGQPQPREVIIPDFEEGQKQMLTAWYNRMMNNLGPGFRPWLWTYSGLFFSQQAGVAPVEWVAAYGQSEPAQPHHLWQFSSNFLIPGVGLGDCSVFHGTIDQLSAMAYPGKAPVPVPVPKPPPPPPPVTVSWAQWPESVTLKLGSSGQAVRVLQAAMARSGIYGVRGISVDGDFGQQTLTAVKNYQNWVFGPSGVDGIAGPRTRQNLMLLNSL